MQAQFSTNAIFYQLIGGKQIGGKQIGGKQIFGFARCAQRLRYKCAVN